MTEFQREKKKIKNMEHNIDNGHIYSNSLCRLSNLTTLDL